MVPTGVLMKILDKPLAIDELKKIAADTFGEMVKAVVDVRQGLVSIDAELHSDLEAFLIENGSRQNNLWGVNFYPYLEGDDFIEFDSMINMRPSQGNKSRGVEDEAICEKIIEIVDRWVTR